MKSHHLLRCARASISIAATSLLLTSILEAKYVGGESPPCEECGTGLPATYSTFGAMLSMTDGNLRESVPVCSGGPALPVGLEYNSYNGDGSQSQIDSGVGYGWTHSFNSFLFPQVGHMFLMGPTGRTQKFRAGAGGTFTPETGYFSRLVRNPDGSYTLTTKDQTVCRFALVPGTPFAVGGPVYRPQTITDRNNNVTTFTYASGDLTKVTDTYGRAVVYTYNAGHHLTKVTDPLGRATTFTYDSTGRRLTKITDPTGKSVQYTYNSLNQILTRTDHDGRVHTITYQNNLPVAVRDSASGIVASLANPAAWATSMADLTANQKRTYTPSTTSRTDGRGNVWQYRYDSNGYVTKLTGPDGTSATYTYDPATLRLSSATDPNGHTTTYNYDAQGNRTKVTDAMGHVTTYTYEPTFNQITSMTDPKGRVTTYDYDPRGNRTKETDPLGQVRTWSYDSHGNVLSETDKNGHTTAYAYDSLGNRVNRTDAGGNVSTMTYDAVGNRLSVTDPLGHTTTYQYDALNRLTKQTDPLNHSSTMVYDGEGQLTQRTDRNGHATTYQYDLRQRLVKTTDATGHVTTNTYDANNNLTSTVDRNGHTTTYQYDTRNRQVSATDPLGHSVTATYDPLGNILTRTDPNGHTTSYEYDALDRRSKITDAAGYVTRFEYDTGGGTGCGTCGATPGTSLVTKQVDGNGKVTYFKYDDLDRRTKTIRKEGDVADVIDSSDAVTTYTYDAAGNRLSVTEPNGNTTSYQYDPLDRQTKITNAAGDVTQMTYDADGNLLTRTSPNGNVTTFGYDSADRAIQVTDSIGTVVTYTYDDAGNRLSVTDGAGHATTFTYDPLDRVTTITDPLLRITQTTYDFEGRVIETIDREGTPTRTLYDAADRRVETIEAYGTPAQRSTTYEYDAAGNLTKRTDANGHATTYAYDALDRTVSETYPDAAPNTRTYTYDAASLTSRTDQLGRTTIYTYNDLYFLQHRSYPVGPTDNFTYDLSGRLLSAERGGWTVTFAYDGANRIVATQQGPATLSYTYNVPGRQRTVTYPGGRTITEKSDARGRLGEVDDTVSPVPIAQYAYDGADRIVSRTARNGIVSTYTYNANDWATRLEHKQGAVLLAGYAHDYDREGNKLFEEHLHQPARSEAYTRDRLYRLTEYRVGTLVGVAVPAPTTQSAYALDAVGNWNSITRNAVVEARTHGAANEILTIGAQGVSHDDTGNLSGDGTYSYAYDEENRLVQVTRIADSAVVGVYAYDALGRRIAKGANPAGVVTTTRYFYDGSRVIEEQDGVGATVATYTYGNAVDEVLTMDRAGQTSYVLPNTLWSAGALADGAGAVVERYDYDAYGTVSVTDGAGVAVPLNAWGTPHSAYDFPYLFTGRQYDEETGIYHYRSRAYDAAKGRFLQRDALGYVDGSNLYEYVQSNPTNWIDPFGFADLPALTKEQTEKAKDYLRNHRDWPDKVIGCNVNDDCRWRPSKKCEVSDADFSAVKPTGIRVEEFFEEGKEVSKTVKSSLEVAAKYKVAIPAFAEIEAAVKTGTEMASKNYTKAGTKVSMQFYEVAGHAKWTDKCTFTYARECRRISTEEYKKKSELFYDLYYYRKFGQVSFIDSCGKQVWYSTDKGALGINVYGDSFLGKKLEKHYEDYKPTGETLDWVTYEKKEGDVRFLKILMPAKD